MYSLYKVHYQLRHHRRDDFIEFIKALLLSPFVLHSDRHKSRELEEDQQVCTAMCDVWISIENLISQHRTHQAEGTSWKSRLYQMVPSIGSFFTDLPLKQAFLEFNHERALSARCFVPPSFNEIRLILNRAQIHAIAAEGPKLITFDGDQTLYENGMNFECGSALVDDIIQLLQCGLYVAIVTAAAYSDDVSRYESRIQGLLAGIYLSSLFFLPLYYENNIKKGPHTHTHI